MQGSQVLTKYKDVPDEEWMQIPFIREIQTTKNFDKFSLDMSIAHCISGTKAAAELFLGVMSQGKKMDRRDLNFCLKQFKERLSSASAVDSSMVWRDTVQGHYFWYEVGAL